MEINNYARLPYSIDDINGLLEKAQNSMDQLNVNDSVSSLLIDLLAPILTRLNTIESNIITILNLLTELLNNNSNNSEDSSEEDNS